MGRQTSSADGSGDTLPGSHSPRLTAGWPTTSAMTMWYISGPSGIRTHDLLNAIETRSQLRHGPMFVDQVDLAGFEPATSSVRLMRAPNCATGP